MPSMREYLKLLADYFESNPAQRFGQAAFNFLWYYSPETADTVWSTLSDPFYNDARLTDFMRELEERWKS